MSGFHISFAYMGTIAVSYLLIPGVYLYPYEAKTSFENFQPIKDLTVNLLKFVAVYSFFDSFYMIFSSAIKGAGDTHFVMKTIGICSVVFLIIPTYICVFYLNSGIYTVWTIGSFYIILLGFISFFRYRNGNWKSMLVIERATPPIPSHIPESPVIDAEL